MLTRCEREGVLTICLEHGKASALDVELLDALARELDAAAAARALVLTGAGPIFCAGVGLADSRARGRTTSAASCRCSAGSWVPSSPSPSRWSPRSRGTPSPAAAWSRWPPTPG
jgi:enoyl-CoA hydratase/carnithine racemase